MDLSLCPNDDLNIAKPSSAVNEKIDCQSLLLCDIASIGDLIGQITLKSAHAAY
jgi:hypothetical protein